MEQFFTRDNANKGIKLPLYTPDGGETEFYLTILGVDSDAYHKADIRERRKLVTLQADVDGMKDAEKEEYIDNAQKQSELEILAALIGGWNLEQECTHENKIKLLVNAPQIADKINKIAGNRKLFFSEGQSNSSSSQ